MITVHLTVHEARALTRAAEFLIDCFGPEVRSELGVGPGETVVEIAALKVESAIERQEFGDRLTIDTLARRDAHRQA